MDKEGLPKTEISESEFNERLRQLETVWRISPEIINNILEEFAKFNTGEGKSERMEKIYKGWNEKDLARLEDAIGDFIVAQPPRKEKANDDLSELTEYEGFKVGDEIEIKVGDTEQSFGLKAQISSFGRDRQGRPVVYCSNWGRDSVLISEISKKE